MSIDTTAHEDASQATHSNGRTNKQAEGFSEHFAELVPLLVEEYEQVDRDTLERTEGDYGQVVALLADKTGKTKVRIKRELADLRDLAGEPSPGKREQLRIMLEKVQAKSNEIADYVRQQMMVDAKSKVGENPLVSLAMAVGLGFLLGFLLRGLGGRERS